MNTNQTNDGRRGTTCVARMLLLLFLLAPAVLNAQFTFVTNNGAITITGYTGSGGDVVIPDTTNGLSVTGVGNNAFKAIGTLASLTIPNTVTNVGNNSFQSCSNLINVTFLNCPTKIGNSAFDRCTSLTNITLGTSVTSIGSYAFRNCTSLTGITIASSVTNIGDYAFWFCANLNTISVESLNSLYCSVDGVLFNKSTNTLIQCPGGKTGSYTVPNGVITIGDYAFRNCNMLTDIAIPGTVTTIYGANLAFSDSANLTAITVDTLNPSFSSVDGVLFNKSRSTLIRHPAAKAGSNYTITNSVTSIGDYAFIYCAGLTSVAIPTSVNSIGGSAFQSCSGLANLTIPNTVTSFGSSVFRSCISLTSLIIPNSISHLGDYTFWSCTSLTNVSIGNSVLSIGQWAFGNCTSLTSIAIPNSVTSIGSDAFRNCTSLSSVTLGNAVTGIWGGAFAYCTALSSVTIPNSVTWLGDWLFQSCTSLTNITIPDSVTSIGSSAFYNCAKLVAVTIPRSVSSIGSDAFLGCTGLSAINVDVLNSSYSSMDGVLFNKSRTTLVRYPEAKLGTHYSISNSVNSIGSSAFASCTKLKSITIPASATSIGDWAFAACPGLRELHFKGNAPNLGSFVFSGDSGVITYFLPLKSGWGTTFGGLPTALWKPQVLTTDDSFGIRTNQFGFNISWASGMDVAVDACTDLANPVWTPLQTNTLTSDTLYFSDPDWTNQPARFYRLRWP